MSADTWVLIFGAIITLAGLCAAAYGFYLIHTEYREHMDELDKWEL